MHSSKRSYLGYLQDGFLLTCHSNFPLFTQYFLRKKVLNGDMTKYSCFRKFYRQLILDWNSNLFHIFRNHQRVTLTFAAAVKPDFGANKIVRTCACALKLVVAISLQFQRHVCMSWRNSI